MVSFKSYKYSKLPSSLVAERGPRPVGPVTLQDLYDMHNPLFNPPPWADFLKKWLQRGFLAYQAWSAYRDLVNAYKYYKAPQVGLGGWQFYRNCTLPPASNWYPSYDMSTLGGCVSTFSAWPGSGSWDWPVNNSAGVVYLHHHINIRRTASLADQRDYRVYRKAAAMTAGPPQYYYPSPAWNPMDPNVERDMPGSKPFLPDPVYREPVPDAWHGEWQKPGTNARPARTHVRQPPKGDTKEKKSKARQYLANLFKILDIISEWSELVDALYEALPQDVKDRWGKGRPSRGLIDNAGQYGVDGVDWKAQALYYNWDKIDTGQALKNIIANELQDRLYGTVYKQLGKNQATRYLGHAADGGMEEFNNMYVDLANAFGLNQPKPPIDHTDDWSVGLPGQGYYGAGQ